MDWANKGRPALDEMLGNDRAREALERWMNAWEEGRVTKACIMLAGPPGCGKTSLWMAACAARGWSVAEFNASDVRSGKKIEALAVTARSPRDVCGRRRCMVMEEADGMDAGGLAALLAIFPPSRVPIICTGNSLDDRRFAALKRAAHIVLMEAISPVLIFQLLKRACQREGVPFVPTKAKSIALSSGGDARAALNAMQADVLPALDRTPPIAEKAAAALFAREGTMEEREAQAAADPFMVAQYVRENYCRQGAPLFFAARAAAAIAEADVLSAAVQHYQDYSLEPIARFRATIVPSHITGRGKRLSFPSVLGQQSRWASSEKQWRDIMGPSGSRSMPYEERHVLCEKLRELIMDGKKSIPVILEVMEGYNLDPDRLAFLFGDAPRYRYDAKMKTALRKAWDARHWDFREVKKRKK